MVYNNSKESSDTSDIAEALNEQVAFVFTEEELKKFPVAENLLQSRPRCKLEAVENIVEDVCKRLTSLREDKSTGADDVSPRILKAISADIAVPVAAISISHCQMV